MQGTLGLSRWPGEGLDPWFRCKDAAASANPMEEKD